MNRQKVLIVDDHLGLLESLRLALEGEYTVGTACSAAQALAAQAIQAGAAACLPKPFELMELKRVIEEVLCV